jgi:hypothetical protein
VIPIFRNEKFLGALLALAAFAVYATTLAPSIGWEEDSGELAASFSTLGITHPTGYPVFTPLAWAFTHLPLGGRDIWKLNLLVALLCSLAVFLFFRVFLFLLSGKAAGLFPETVPLKAGRAAKAAKAPKAAAEPSDTALQTVAAAVAALILAFSKTFWSEAVSIEVYALHLVFLGGASWLFLRALSAAAPAPAARPGREWYLFAAVLGLSFAHHMMTVLLAPAFLYLYFVVHGAGRAAWKKIGLAVAPFLAGLLAYLYIPLRAAQEPLMSWGNPSTLGRFWFHVSAGQYRYKMFASLDGALDKLVGFAKAFPAEFGYAPLIFMLIGAWTLFRSSRRLLVFTGLLFLSGVFFSMNYGFDDPNFYLNAYVSSAFWAGAGVKHFLAAARKRGLAVPGGILCVLAAGFPLLLNHRAVDQSDNHAVEDYARNMFRSLDSGAVVLTGQYGIFSAPAYYLQLAEGERSDVLILDTQLLKFPWYYAQLERRYPWLIRAARPEVDAFLRANERYERETNLDSASFMRYNFAAYANVIRSFLEHSIAARPVYVTVETKVHPDWGFGKVPSGLAFRLYRKADGSGAAAPPPPSAPRMFAYRPLPSENPMAVALANHYAVGYLNQGLYSALASGDTATGIALMRQAVALNPDFFIARDWLARLGG